MGICFGGGYFFETLYISKLRPITGQIFASKRGVPHFNALARGDPLRISG